MQIIIPKTVKIKRKEISLLKGADYSLKVYRFASAPFIVPEDTLCI